jgi:MscS family membrane protein
MSTPYYGNTAQQWLYSLIIVLGAVLAGKVLYWLSSNILKKIALRSKPGLHYVLLDNAEEPVILAVVLAGCWYALVRLSLSAGFEKWLYIVLKFLVVGNVAWLVSRLVNAMCEEYLEPLAKSTDNELDDQLLPILRKGSKLIIWVLAIIIALDNAGYDVGALLTGLGLGGLAFAMAAQHTLKNIFGGITVFMDRPFKINDRIRIAGFDGFVREIGLRSTRIETLENRIITIPNSRFADEAIEISALSLRGKLSVISDWFTPTPPDKVEQAMDILRRIGREHDNLDELVLVSFNEFRDSSLNLCLSIL